MNKLKAIISLILISILCLSLASCGSDSAESAADIESKDEISYEYDGVGALDDSAAASDDNKAKNFSSSLGTKNGETKKGNFKLIYRAEVYLQTLDFNKSMSEIEKLVNNADGYFENRQIDNGSYYRNADSKSAYFTIRVPSAKYQDFLSAVSGSCHVVSMSQNIEDIGDLYYDTESRIKTLQIKEERLQALLAKATKMSDIIELESALSENEHSLDMYKTQLRDYDSLVDYSTITLSLESVDVLSEDVNAKLSFGEKLSLSMKNGASDFTRGLGSLVIWLGYNILNIALLLVIAVIIIRFRPLKSFVNLIKTKRPLSKSAKKSGNDIASPEKSSEDKK